MKRFSKELLTLATVGTVLTMLVGGCAPETGQPVIAAPAATLEGPKIMAALPTPGAQLRAMTPPETIQFLSQQQGENQLKHLLYFSVPVFVGQISLAAECANGGCVVLRDAVDPQKVIGIGLSAKALTQFGVADKVAIGAGIINMITGSTVQSMGEGLYQYNAATGRLEAIPSAKANVQASVAVIKDLKQTVDTTIGFGEKAIVRISATANQAAGDATFKNPSQGPGQIKPTPEMPNQAPLDKEKTEGKDLPKPIKKILVLDDSKSWREITTEILESKGYSVVTASSNEEALKLLREGGIDGVVSDWNLDPNTRPQGPHADPTIKLAQQKGIPVFVQTGTDDSTGLLSDILKSDQGLVVKHEKDATMLSSLNDFFQQAFSAGKP